MWLANYVLFLLLLLFTDSNFANYIPEEKKKVISLGSEIKEYSFIHFEVGISEINVKDLNFCSMWYFKINIFVPCRKMEYGYQ